MLRAIHPVARQHHATTRDPAEKPAWLAAIPSVEVTSAADSTAIRKRSSTSQEATDGKALRRAQRH